MKKSIETIWKEGFLKTDALVAPQVNDLYNQKSLHIIDQFKRMFKINRLYVIGLATVHLILGILGGVTLIGVYLFLLFLPLIISSQQQMRKIAQVDKTASSYQYVKTFQNWLQECIAQLERIYAFFYPLYFLGIILACLFTSFFELFIGERIIDKIMNYSGTYLINGLPIIWIIAIIIIVGLAGYFSKALYRMDLNMVYGNIIARLEELLKDMEALKR